MAKAVREYRADVGIALDGDADRVIFVDEHGNEVDGDHIMAICACDMLQQGTLTHKTLVATVMSNMGLDIALRKAGGKVIKTAVGDRYVTEEMLRSGYNLGGEKSGHMIFFDHNSTGDGTLSALQLLAIMQRSGKPLSELAKVMTALPQILCNVRVKERVDLASVPEVSAVIKKCEEQLGKNGRVLIRYSGTEPLLRIMLEGQEQKYIDKLAGDIVTAVETYLGGVKEESK